MTQLKFKIIVTKRDMINEIVRKEFELSGDVSHINPVTVNDLAYRIERILNSEPMGVMAIRVHSSVEDTDDNSSNTDK